MKSIANQPDKEKRQIGYVLTDIDDTLTFKGKLPAVVLAAMDRKKRMPSAKRSWNGQWPKAAGAFWIRIRWHQSDTIEEGVSTKPEAFTTILYLFDIFRYLTQQPSVHLNLR